MDISTLLGPPAALTAHTSTEEHVKNVSKAVKVAKSAEISKIPEASETAGAVGSFKGCVPELIVLLPQLLIAEHPVGFSSFFEFLLGIGVVLVDIGMVLAGQAAVSLLDVRLRGVPINPQNLVVISLGHHCTAFLCQFNSPSN
jgi:hypothetical protein